MPCFDADGVRVDYETRRSSRARRVLVTVGSSGVELVIPTRCSAAFANEFLMKKRRWVVRKLAEIAGRDSPARVPRWPSEFRDGTAVPFRGGFVNLSIDPAAPDGRMTLTGGRLMAGAGAGTSSTALAAATAAWLARAAGDEMAFHASRYAGILGVRPSAIRVRSMKTLWGSCSQRGVVTLNWQLAFFEDRVLEYAVVHEMCHLLHRGHGPAFWGLVGRVMPGFEGHRDFLRRQPVRKEAPCLRPFRPRMPVQDRREGAQ
jgi:predicted metal-dependent hydrolase